MTNKKFHHSMRAISKNKLRVYLPYLDGLKGTQVYCITTLTQSNLWSIFNINLWFQKSAGWIEESSIYTHQYCRYLYSICKYPVNLPILFLPEFGAFPVICKILIGFKFLKIFEALATCWSGLWEKKLVHLPLIILFPAQCLVNHLILTH